MAELDLNDSPVTQTKTAFDWAGDLENEFVDGLHEVTSDYVEKCQTVVSDEPPRPSKSDGEVAGDTTTNVLTSSDVDEAVVIVETPPHRPWSQQRTKSPGSGRSRREQVDPLTFASVAREPLL